MSKKDEVNIDRDLEELDVILKELEELKQVDELKGIDLNKIDAELEKELENIPLENEYPPFYYLKKAYDLVIAKAIKITDKKMRKSFLENVKINKEIIEEMKRVKNTEEWKNFIDEYEK